MKRAASTSFILFCFAAVAGANTVLMNGTFNVSALDPWRQMTPSLFLGPSAEYASLIPRLMGSYDPSIIQSDPSSQNTPQTTPSEPVFQSTALWAYWMPSNMLSMWAAPVVVAPPKITPTDPDKTTSQTTNNFDVTPVAELNFQSLTQGQIAPAAVPVSNFDFNSSGLGVQMLVANSINPVPASPFDAEVPEPSTGILMAFGGAAAAMFEMRRRLHAKAESRA